MDTGYHLRYILYCLGLKTSGTKEELITRIKDHGIKPGDGVFDPSCLKDESTSLGLNSCPTYLLKAYLKKHGLAMTGDKTELVARARQRLGLGGKIFEPEDKSLVVEAIRAVDRGSIPNEEAIHAMELHGYLYDSAHNTFINLETRQKVLGEKSLFESIWFVTYPTFPSEIMEFIATE